MKQVFFCPNRDCPGAETFIVAPGYVSEWTVERLFAEVQDGIDLDFDVVDATYDPELGYPTRIHTNSDLFSEGSVFLTVTDFQVLK